MALIFSGLQFLVYIWTFFVGSIYGILFSSIALYLCSEKVFGVNAYGFLEMVAWFYESPTEIKTALMTSFITVLGFLMAFATASYNWKSQVKAQLKLQASGELDVFFKELSGLINDFDVHVKQVIHVYNKLKEESGLGAVFMVRHSVSCSPPIIEKRALISKLSLDVYWLDGKYSRLLQSMPGLEERMMDSKKAIKSITRAMWISIPDRLDEELGEIDSYKSQVNIGECEGFIKISKEGLGILAASQGAIRGALQAEFLGVGFWHIFYSFKNSKDMGEALKNFRSDLQSIRKR